MDASEIELLCESLSLDETWVTAGELGKVIVKTVQVDLGSDSGVVSTSKESSYLLSQSFDVVDFIEADNIMHEDFKHAPHSDISGEAGAWCLDQGCA
ncbi:hypothetical protein ACOSQ3_002358 [Xanthoceras sorbifolium]